MAEQGKARGRAAAWRPWTGAWRPAWAWPAGVAGFAAGAARRLRAWALADVGPGRLVPWLAVGFGFGIVLYFPRSASPRHGRRPRSLRRPSPWQ
jgi:competence protein ComEC